MITYDAEGVTPSRHVHEHWAFLLATLLPLPPVMHVQAHFLIPDSWFTQRAAGAASGAGRLRDLTAIEAWPLYPPPPPWPGASLTTGRQDCVQEAAHEDRGDAETARPAARAHLEPVAPKRRLHAALPPPKCARGFGRPLPLVRRAPFFSPAKFMPTSFLFYTNCCGHNARQSDRPQVRPDSRPTSPAHTPPRPEPGLTNLLGLGHGHRCCSVILQVRDWLRLKGGPSKSTHHSTRLHQGFAPTVRTQGRHPGSAPTVCTQGASCVGAPCNLCPL
jgi:hypothetical protein